MSPSAPRLLRRLPLNSSELGLIAAILAVIVLTTLLDSGHNYWHDPAGSLRQIIWHTSMLGIFSLGAALVIITGGIDLSSGSMIAFSASVCASLILLLAPEAAQNVRQPVGWTVIGLAIAGTVAAGFLIGSLHAWLITVIGLPPFIATLATLVGLRSFARWIVKRVTFTVSGAERSQITLFDDAFQTLGNSYVGPLIAFVVLAVFCTVLLNRTTVGRHLYALGGNEQAARLSGIRTDRLKWMAYSLSAVFSSIAGILYLSYLMLAKPEILARGYELNGIAAAVVGGCSLQGGAGTILGTVLGCVFLRTVIDGIAKIIKSDANTYEGLIVGIVVVLAVAFNQLREAGRTQIRFFAGALGAVMVLTLALLAGVLGGLIAGRTAAVVAGLVALAVLGTVKFLEGRFGRR